MSFTGTIQKGQVVLTNPVTLPEGASVIVSIESIEHADAPAQDSLDWLAEVEKLARPRQWPEGYMRGICSGSSSKSQLQDKN